MTNADTIKEEVAGYYKIPMEKFVSKSRRRPLPEARFVAMYFMRKEGMQLHPIKDEFNFKDHSSIIHGLYAIDEWMDSDKKFKSLIEILGKIIDSKIHVNKWIA